MCRSHRQRQYLRQSLSPPCVGFVRRFGVMGGGWRARAAAKQCLTPELASLASNGLITCDARPVSPPLPLPVSFLPKFGRLGPLRKADGARINYVGEWSRSNFSTSFILSPPRPLSRYSCAPLRIEIRSALRCRSLMSCAGMSRFSPHLPRPIQLPGIRPRPSPRPRCCSVRSSKDQQSSLLSPDRRWQRRWR